LKNPPVDPAPAAFTLEQLCRALAAHCLLTAHPERLHEFTAPEVAEQTAQFIFRFAQGEPLERPTMRNDAPD
jgi:hypothetical protein